MHLHACRASSLRGWIVVIVIEMVPAVVSNRRVFSTRRLGLGHLHSTIEQPCSIVVEIIQGGKRAFPSF